MCAEAYRCAGATLALLHRHVLAGLQGSMLAQWACCAHRSRPIGSRGARG